MNVIDFLVRKMDLSSMREKIVRNLFWSVFGKVVTLLGSLFVGIVVARYLGPEQYGLMNYVISYVFLFQVISTFGLDNIEIREEAKSDIPFTTILGSAFGVRCSLAVLAIFLTVVTSLVLESSWKTTLLVTVYSCSVLANTFTVIRNYFLSIVQNEYVVKSEISRTAIGISIKLILLWMRASLFWFIVASVFDVVFLASGYIVAYRTRIGHLHAWTFNRRYAFYLLREGFPLLLSSGAVIIYQRIDQVMIGQMVDNVSVGYFSTAAKFVEVLIFIPMMLSQTISPVLVVFFKEDKVAYRQKSQLFMNFSFWLSFLMAVSVSVFSYWIVLYSFGEKYLPAVAVLQVLAFKAPSVALSSSAGCMLVIEGLQKWAVIRDSLGCLVCVLLNYLLLPRFGVLASALVAILSNVAAGYLADAFIPAYRHLFVQQSRALLLGWKDLIHFQQLLKSSRP